ncbi:hypothetical protein AALA22_12790 [Anaerovoracaceae bacterium 41-7]|jgi:hypothetical protein|uniref:hypothetical protein n=1 Tax=Anaerovoracaceae TaxID=543314 RepID=UPI00203B1768|nr:hypothetical protein [Senimuribacter intestinalis]MCI9476967.1 hypothetical protein [Emergencia sp.]
MKRKVISVFFIGLLLLGNSRVSFGDTEKIMYAKEQTWLYSSGHETARYAVVPIGKNQKVATKGLVKAILSGGRKVYYYEVECLGQILYIPRSKVSSRKPAKPVSIRYLFKELKVDDKIKIHDRPSILGKVLKTKDRSIYTIGQAGNWYVVYIEGKIGYIRKNSDSIKNVRKPDYIPIRISDKEYPDTAERTNMKERIYLQYAQLSQKIRERLMQRNVEIYCKEHFIEPFEGNGSLGYTESRPHKAVIYLKDEGIEFSFIHEVGHAVTRYLLNEDKDLDKLLLEQRKLKLEPYYAKSMSEWAAEILRVLVKSPKELKEKAPRSYLFLMRQVLNVY